MFILINMEINEQKQFVFAHEIMHVAFNHILRSKGRNQRLWNIATDSVINQILKNEKLSMTEGGVDITEAVNHSAEEMYEKLLKKKELHDQEKEQKQERQQPNPSMLNSYKIHLSKINVKNQKKTLTGENQSDK